MQGSSWFWWVVTENHGMQEEGILETSAKWPYWRKLWVTLDLRLQYWMVSSEVSLNPLSVGSETISRRIMSAFI